MLVVFDTLAEGEAGLSRVHSHQGLSGSISWALMRIYQETSFAFRKRVEDYQLERTSVGLSAIPAKDKQ